MASKAFSSQGIAFKMKVSGTYTLITQIHNFQCPPGKNPSIEVTAAEDTSVRRISKRLLDYGPVTFDFWLKASDNIQQLLDASMIAGTLEDFEVICPDVGSVAGTTYQWLGQITEISPPKGKVGDPMAVSVTITVDGAVTKTAAT